ncbi:MAG: hypothetical protein QXN05_00030 [Acidilobaceae archaeon]
MSLRSNTSKTIRVGNIEARVVKERYNPLIGRFEIELEINHLLKPTPSRQEVREAVTNAYGVSIERVYVQSLQTEYGAGITKAVVHVYDNAERARAIEPKHIIKRNERSSG